MQVASIAGLTATVTWLYGGTPVLIDNTPATAQNGSIVFDPSTDTATVYGSYDYPDAGQDAIRTVFFIDGQEVALVDSLATVTNALTVSANSDVAAARGSAQSLTLATFTDSDSSLTAGDFVATVTWQDDSTSLASVSAGYGGQFNISVGRAIFADGSQPFTVSVSDPSGAVASDNGSESVSDSGSPSLQGWGTLYDWSGTSFDNTLATFIDPAGPLPVADYSVSIAVYTTAGLDDDLQPTPNISYDSGTQQFTVSCSCTLPDPDDQWDQFVVTVTRQSGGTPLTLDCYVAEGAEDYVTPSGRHLTPTEGQQFSNVVIASFLPSDPNAVASDFSVSVDAGEENSLTTTVQANDDGGFDVLATGTYPEAGHLTIPITINGSTLYDTVDVAAGISDLTAGSALSGSENSPVSGVLATFSSNTDLSDDPFQAVVNWGDGITSQVAVTESDGVFSVDAGHTYTQTGNYDPTVQIYTAQGVLVGSLSGTDCPVAF
jgi:hypothetical protein